MTVKIDNLSNPPTKGVVYSFDTCVYDPNGKGILTSVPLAAGDIQVYQDGVLIGEIKDLPIEIKNTGVLVVALSADEMNASRVTLKFHDPDGAWNDSLITFSTVSGCSVATVTFPG
jgi:hypothetical protein